MLANLPKKNKPTTQQAESDNNRLSLFAMWNNRLGNLSDVELKARQLVNKIAAKLPQKTKRTMNSKVDGTENQPPYLTSWPNSLPSWHSKTKAQSTEEESNEQAALLKKSNLPEFLQRQKPNYDDLRNFPIAKAENIILPTEETSNFANVNSDSAKNSGQSEKMPQVLADLKKKLNFDFLGSKEDKQNIVKPRKTRPGQLDKLSDAELEELLRQITVIAFVGPSGTGKSTRASQVAFLSKCNYIIDDALLIKENHIVAGSSAKRAKTKIESVRQAIFLDPIRAQTMKRALVSHLPERLLILGTSKSMINKICQALSLQFPQEWVDIKDVATESEIKQARYNRIHTGQHAIPVPSMELKHEFSGSIFEPLQLLRQRFSAKDIASGVKEIRNSLPTLASYALTTSSNKPLVVEQSIVRPSFSVLGHYSITDQALKNIVFYSLQKVEAVQRLRECKVRQETSGLVFNVNLALYYGYNAQKALSEAQAAIVEAVSRLTAMNILQITLVADKLVQASEPRAWRK